MVAMLKIFNNILYGIFQMKVSTTYKIGFKDDSISTGYFLGDEIYYIWDIVSKKSMHQMTRIKCLQNRSIGSTEGC